MGKRVHIEHVGWDIMNPHRSAGAFLSCGHTVSKGISAMMSSSGDPHWCEKCEGQCRACGASATTRTYDTYYWGEACATCEALPKQEWNRRVKARDEVTFHLIAGLDWLFAYLGQKQNDQRTIYVGRCNDKMPDGARCWLYLTRSDDPDESKVRHGYPASIWVCPHHGDVTKIHARYLEPKRRGN